MVSSLELRARNIRVAEERGPLAPTPNGRRFLLTHEKRKKEEEREKKKEEYDPEEGSDEKDNDENTSEVTKQGKSVALRFRQAGGAGMSPLVVRVGGVFEIGYTSSPRRMPQQSPDRKEIISKIDQMNNTLYKCVSHNRYGRGWIREEVRRRDGIFKTT